MKRNNEAHFNQVPRISMSRSRFKRDQDHKTTFDAGVLIPFYVDEVLPGDTFSIDNSAIIRMTTPIFPVMDNAYLDYYYFFVPNRIIWDHWKEFMGEVTSTPWVQKVEYTVPQLQLSNGTAGEEKVPYEGSILDYMGVPTKIIKGNTASSASINALPIRAYVKIWNEWFRDQNVDNPATLTTGDETRLYQDTDGTNLNDVLNRAINGGRPLPVNKFHDYFTSALPSPQRSEESALIPLSGNAAVRGYTDASMTTLVSSSFDSGSGGSLPSASSIQVHPSGSGRNFVVSGNIGSGTFGTAYLGTDLSAVQAATINQLRQAFQVQKFWEESARGGSRYRELVKSYFGATISDKTVQVPEYLGGDRIMINVNQVVQTSGTTDNSPQGNVAAVSVTPYNKSAFTKSFEEHGWVIGVCCVRHDHTYQQGLERMWSRKNKLDYYFPVFANLGEQAIEKKEIYMDGTENDEKAFGYQEAWADYRMKPNRVSGLFRSNATGTLDSWHYADNYTATPTLSQEWMKEGKSEIQRTLAVQDEPQFIMDILVKNTCVRVMPTYSVPGLIDHH